MATFNVPALPASRRPPRPPTNRNGLLLPLYNPRGSLIHSSHQPFQLHHAVNRATNSSRSELRQSSSRSTSRSRFLPRKPMAVVAGAGAALSLRIPSASVAPSMGRRRRAAVRCGATRARPAVPGGGLEEDHYRTLRLAPGATRGEVKKAFHRLALQYHPDVVCRDGHQDDGVDFERINAAYQTVMRNMRAAEARLEYWRRRYGLADEDLDRYRHYLNDDKENDWFADL